MNQHHNRHAVIHILVSVFKYASPFIKTVDTFIPHVTTTLP